jgi:hypothetical protein
METKLSVIAKTNGKFCDDYCPGLLNVETSQGYKIYCGFFGSKIKTHELRLENEEVCRHDECNLHIDDRRLLNVELVQEKLDALHIDRHDLANSLDVSYSTVGKWLCHSTFPNRKILPAFAALLKVKIYDLIIYA